MDDNSDHVRLYRNLIASGMTRDEFIGNSISNSPRAIIGSFTGLDERKTREEIANLLKSIDGERFDRALRNYFRAL
jgi:hypothetical protein